LSISEFIALPALVERLNETDRQRLLDSIFDGEPVPEDIREQLRKLMNEGGQSSG
jgi:hypothetical protein